MFHKHRKIVYPCEKKTLNFCFTPYIKISNELKTKIKSIKRQHWNARNLNKSMIIKLGAFYQKTMK